MGIADGTEVLFIGGLQSGELGRGAYTCPGVYRLLKQHAPLVHPTHQGGGSCLGRRSGQVSQHLFHLGQLLSADVIRIWMSSR